MATLCSDTTKIDRKARSNALFELIRLTKRGTAEARKAISQAIESKWTENPQTPTMESAHQIPLEKTKPFFMVQNYEQVPLLHELI